MRILSCRTPLAPGPPAEAGRLGFDAVLIEGADARLHDNSARAARSAGLKLIVDVELERFPIDHPLVEARPEAFRLRRSAPAGTPVDPRRPAPAIGEAQARLADPEVAQALLPSINERLAERLRQGADGIRLLRPDSIDPAALSELLKRLRADFPGLVVIGQMAGVPREAAQALGRCGLDHVTNSFSHWDLAAPWIAEEYEALRMVAPPIAEVTGDALARAPGDRGAERLLLAAAAAGQGLVLPADLFDRGLQAATERAFSLADAAQDHSGEMRLLASASGTTALLRFDPPDMRSARKAMLVLVNRSLDEPSLPRREDILAIAGGEFSKFQPARTRLPGFSPLAPAEVRALFAERSKPIAARRVGNARAAAAAAALPRLVIGDIAPSVDSGRYPVKRIVGDVVAIEADIFGDGHEQLAVELRWRAEDEKTWRSVRMKELGNDRWSAFLSLDRLGRHEFVVEGWIDRYGGFRRDFRKKRDAGVAQPVDFQEGRLLVEAARQRSDKALASRLEDLLRRIDEAKDEDEAAALLLDAELALLMDEADDRPFAITSDPMPIDAERLAARFSSWYELFPRSITDDPERHGTFADVIERMPAIRAMGFDTLYFPPIHPIGRKHRKGRNNSLEAGPDDPGSPYAIGSDEGGHNAIHPELGTIEDFRRMVAAARSHGLEIALDFAIQCSPDHPWLKAHPGWFDWRPDGTIKYAENPPKKYQDIVNVDFYRKEAVPDLWVALRDVVLFWIGEGVKTFRVDNPHTKPLPFWEWMIGDIRRVHPDAIFLAEAFTRPKLMYHLAKIGFSQSYTYFTWRNGKAELRDYLTELTTTAPADFFRPHFFVNTPDINPVFLQTSGRAGFRIRAALASTLSGLFGVYSGFELCESRPVPGKEEYWESEKYEIKPRNWNAPGNIIDDITLFNRLRRAHPALQSHLGLTFYNVWNDHILYYGKRSPDGAEMVLVAVSLDPHNAQEGDFEVPLWEWKLPDHESVDVEDLAASTRFQWTGKVQRIRLTPDEPYRIWRIAPVGGLA